MSTFIDIDCEEDSNCVLETIVNNLQCNSEEKGTNNIIVKLSEGKTFGKYINGNIINAKGKTALDIIKDAVTERINPIYTLPSLSLSYSPTNKQEFGSEVTLTLSPTYNKNDAGSLIHFSILKNGTIIYTNSNNILNYSDTIVLGSFNYQCFVNYNQGAIKYDNLGDLSPNGSIDEGTIYSNPINITGYYKTFFDSSSVIPTTSTQIRNLNNVLDVSNTFILNTGITDKYFILAIPVNKNMTSIIDLDALNLNITNEYVLINSNFEVIGPNNYLMYYKLYIKENSVPYINNHRHYITIT